jgi:amino acid permease
MAGLILFSFTAPGALVSVPFAVGTTGYVLSLLILSLFTAATIVGCLMLLEIYQCNPYCQNLPELGAVALGSVRGRQLAATVQLSNFVGFLPVSLTINALALQGTLGVAPEHSCLDYYILGISVLCLLSTQARALSNTQALSLLSLTAILAAGAIQLGVAFSPSLMPSPRLL